MCENSTDIIRRLAIFLHKMIDPSVSFLAIFHNWDYTTTKRRDKRLVKKQPFSLCLQKSIVKSPCLTWIAQKYWKNRFRICLGIPIQELRS